MLMYSTTHTSTCRRYLAALMSSHLHVHSGFPRSFTQIISVGASEGLISSSQLFPLNFETQNVF